MDKNTLLNYMPKYYKTSKIIDNLNNANATELDNFSNKINDVADQFFINTADFTLSRWENEFGIEVNNNYDTEFRRSRIISKIRGQGTVTINLIKNVAQSFSNGDVNVIENNATYSFTIKFISTKGIPANIDDLKAAIENIKPAHLGIEYEFIYNTWQDIKTITWLTAKTSTWEDLKTR